jgi:hypothetical protein
MNPILQRLAPLLLAAVLCQCGVPSLPQCRRVPTGSRAPAASLIAEARSDWAILANTSRSSEWPAARARYNGAVAKLFDQLRCGPDGWDTRAAAIGTRIAAPDSRQTNLSNLDVVFPASTVNGNLVKIHRTTEGVGVPLVGWKKTSPVGQKRDKFLLPNGLPYNLTASLAFDEAGMPVWYFDKRWNKDELQVGSATPPPRRGLVCPQQFLLADVRPGRPQNSECHPAGPLHGGVRHLLHHSLRSGENPRRFRAWPRFQSGCVQEHGQ